MLPQLVAGAGGLRPSAGKNFGWKGRKTAVNKTEISECYFILLILAELVLEISYEASVNFCFSSFLSYHFYMFLS